MSINALIISTEYPKTISNCDIWNEEIQEDAKTIQEIFPHRLELVIPAGKLSSSMIKRQVTKIYQVVDELVRNKDTKINIILNTHGAPGSYDIDNIIIIKLLRCLSLKGIKIDTMYALLCHGFEDKLDQIHLSMAGQPVYQIKKSSLRNLQESLQKLNLRIPQHFEIKGFKRAYDPKQDKIAVVNLLQGHAEDSTEVLINKIYREDRKAILKYIEIIGYRDVSTLGTSRAYTIAKNKLAIVLQKINDNIYDFLNGQDSLKPSSVALFESVKSFAKLSDKPSSKQYYDAYQSWKKTYKLCDDERLKILKSYCITIDEESVDDVSDNLSLPMERCLSAISADPADKLDKQDFHNKSLQESGAEVIKSSNSASLKISHPIIDHLYSKSQHLCQFSSVSEEGNIANKTSLTFFSPKTLDPVNAHGSEVQFEI